MVESFFKGDDLPIAFDLEELLLVHAFHVSADVHFLLGAVHAIRTLELGLFAALPLLMVS